MHEILVVEDEKIIRDSLSRLLKRYEYSVIAVSSVDEAIKEGLDGFDLVVADIRMPGRAGTDLIELASPVPVLIMTSYSTVQTAVDAMKKGAIDYIAKPYNHDEMILTVKRILAKKNLEERNRSLQRELDSYQPVKDIIGRSEPVKQVIDHIQRVATTDSAVMIVGETGTGKELAARAIHAASHRKDLPLISINCASIPENLLEAELFGYEKGAFTGATQSYKGLIAAADKGTLFLDEIGELSHEAQAQLLRVLQEGEVRRVGSNRMQYVDIRIICATHRNLKQMIEDKKFREDLYYRLNVIEITMPPLRDRGEDIIDLANLILEKISTRFQREKYRLSQAAREQLLVYQWPGNVRELENVLERAIILSNGSIIEVSDLSLNTNASHEQKFDLKLDLSLDEYFIEYVKNHQQEMNETELSSSLGISRKNLWERRQKLGISRS